MDDEALRTSSGSSLRRSLQSIAILIVLGIAFIAPTLNRAVAVVQGTPCLGPQPISAPGPTSQLSIQLFHLIPKYYEDCPTASGTVSYQALGDQAATEAAIRHDRGPDASRPYTFYATDLTLTTAEWYETWADFYHPFRPAFGSNISHLPVYVAGIAIAYKPPTSCTFSERLRFSGQTLSLIYSGLVSTWNHMNIVQDNPGVVGLSNCSATLVPAVRVDQAASTIVFKDYLSQRNDLFDAYKAKELNNTWPPTLIPNTTCRATNVQGMSECLSVGGTVGYVEYQEAYGKTNYEMALVQNGSNQYETPATNVSSDLGQRTRYPDRCGAAAASVSPPATNQNWGQFTLANASTGYPICHYSYLLVFQRLNVGYIGTLTSGQMRNTYDYLMAVFSNRVQDGLIDYRVSPLPTSPRDIRTTVLNGAMLISE